jgi:glyoxylase-like metal-dependent hydrolase (beta-lactamase superfamily II)
LSIFHTPGHSPGSATLYWPAQKALFTGDLIFKEGFGRTDLPGGDSATLKESIKRMAELDVELLLSGHGAYTLHLIPLVSSSQQPATSDQRPVTSTRQLSNFTAAQSVFFLI